MDLDLFKVLTESNEFQKIESCIRGRVTPCSVFGLPDGAKTHLVATIKKLTNRPIIYIAHSEQRAERVAVDLSYYLNTKIDIFPARQNVLHQGATSNNLNEARVGVLNSILNGKDAVVTTIDALMHPLTPAPKYKECCFVIKTGDTVDLKNLLYFASSAGYISVSRVEAKGQFSHRGGIFDIYPPSADEPLRIEFFSDEVDSIREFSPDTQRSKTKVDSVMLTPAKEIILDSQLREKVAEVLNIHLKQQLKKQPLVRLSDTFAPIIEGIETDTLKNVEALLPFIYDSPAWLGDYLENAIIMVDEPKRIRERAENIELEFRESFKSMLEDGKLLPAQAKVMFDYDHLLGEMRDFQVLTYQMLTVSVKDFIPKSMFTFTAKAMQGFSGQEEQFFRELKNYIGWGYNVTVIGGGKHKCQRIEESIRNSGIFSSAIRVRPGDITQGFDYPELKFAVVSEQDIFGAHMTKVSKKSQRRIDTFVELNIGDHVVHENHGIGVYEGLIKIETDGVHKDYFAIRYSGTDKLYVPVENMDVVQKYIGSNDNSPRLSKLGTQEWTNTKNKVRQGIRDMTEELVKLYASRENVLGVKFSPDTPWQRQFEDDFQYEETPDQLQSISEIKADMESDKAMDRLLCGDVGYGKTEVAIRAAFKAVMDNKQVAVLCPTTILAQQHFNTITQRMFNYGVTCEVLSRFRNAAEQKEIMKKLKSGSIDIIVGTHRLLSKDIVFNDLGLLVVDEEQRFGVSHKEKIKQLKNSVDVLTLSATPIPRTLHMALSGIRDLSVIETAPQERFPVQTYVLEYTDTLVREAIMREAGRGGQAYFLYNNVANMDKFSQYLSNLLPELRIISAHGQMPENVLEKTISTFYSGEADVLLCSTIIENGIDIPTVNTIIVYDADNFGLSQLYQLKGRVGRSNRLAYAYMLYRKDSVLTETAEKRLTAIRDFTALGSGFKIAMRDLEIRGAGNLLGGEQHGHMSIVGYDMYCKLLQEAISESKGIEVESRIETKIEIKYDAYIPEHYIKDEIQKIQMYRAISNISSKADALDVSDELIDRFGDIPMPVHRLLDIALLKGLSSRAGIIRVTDSGTYAECFFDATPDFARLSDCVAKNKLCHINANGPVSVVLKKRTRDFVKELIEIIDDYVTEKKR